MTDYSFLPTSVSGSDLLPDLCPLVASPVGLFFHPKILLAFLEAGNGKTFSPLSGVDRLLLGERKQASWPGAY